MKNFAKLFVAMRSIAIIALVAVIGFGLVACGSDDDNSGNGDPALTGIVSISGTAQVGETLTAVTTSLSGSGTITYQWKSGTGNVGTNSNTYEVQSTDVGNTITVTVTRAGFTGSVTSGATATVTAPCETHTPNTETGKCTVCGYLTYSVGDTGPGGGTIAYVSTSGFTVEGYGSSGDTGYFATYTAHYLEIAPSNSSAFAQWGAHGTLISGVTTFITHGEDSVKRGNGRKDTMLIVAHLATTSETDRAAQLAVSADFSGKNDWFLPSMGELNSIDLLPYGLYWSSSQLDDNRAWIKMGNMDQSNKNTGRLVRAVRAF